MEDEWGRARVARQGVSGIDQINEAIETCPVDCISWVSQRRRGQCIEQQFIGRA
jgi:ferredoxin